MKNRACLQLLTVAALAGGIGLGAAGCLNRRLAPAEPSSQSGVVQEYRQTGITKVDLLFVIDNSNSMEEEQRILGGQIEVMVKELIDPTPRAGGTPTPAAVRDLHIGIVSTDMGVGGGGFIVQTCNDPYGDRGELNGTGNTRIEGCQANYPGDCPDGTACPWLVHSDSAPDNDPNNSPIWEDFKCLATLGTGGCGYEQQLEASLQALDPQGNARQGGPNYGFLRNDSLLAVIYVTDEDDCSTNNMEIFDPARDDLGADNLRCFENKDRLYPVSRYYDFFVNTLRGGDRESVVVAAITGIPDDERWSAGDPLEALAAMERVRADDNEKLEPSCSSEYGVAFPPVRIVELVYMFETNGILQSICQNDWEEALRAITRKIQSKLGGSCPERPLANTSAEVCRVVETLIDDAPCPHPAVPANSGAERQGGWQVDQGLVEVQDNGQTVSRRRCEILPADYDGNGCPDGVGAADCDAEQFGGGLQGWFYDNSSDDPSCQFGQVRFTSTELTGNRSDVRFECQTALCPARRQLVVPEGQRQCNVFSCANNQDCGNGETCVAHNSVAICGAQSGSTDTPCSCSRCEPTIGSICPVIQANDPPSVSGQPLIKSGGCCAEGFHVEENSNGCVPDRTTRCL